MGGRRKHGRAAPHRRIRAFRLRRYDEELAVISYPLPEAAQVDDLTDAERDVVEGIVHGSTTEEIAAARGTSPHTVSNQLASVFDKLGVNGRAELMTVLAGAGEPERDRP